MISFGTNIQSTAECLTQRSLESVVGMVKNPDPELESKVRQLRIVRKIDQSQYAQLKRTLPYIVCSLFLPAYRKQDNFAYTNYFCLDIDHLQEKGINAEELKSKLRADARVRAMFISPSEDGLKLFFMLSESCYDKGLYSSFYKKFASAFSVQYNLEQVVDTRTSDVTRACFLSVDKDAYYNAAAQAVVLKDYVDEDDMQGLFDDLKQIKEEEKKIEKREREEHIADPDKQTMEQIRQMLNPKAPKVEAAVFVPEILEVIIDGLHDFIASLGVEVVEIRNIQYAKKIICRLGVKRAEVNLFYGKKGFSVVPSPKAGTDAELNGLIVEVVQSYIDSL